MSSSNVPKTNTFKIVFCGDSAVGKTTILRKFVAAKDPAKQKEIDNQVFGPTINVDCLSREIVVNDQTYLLLLWDTAGQEAYRSVSVSYFRNARGIILVYDVTQRETFDKLDDWVNLIKEHTKDVPFVIFGNKNDLTDQIKVTEDESMSYAFNNDTSAYIGSAKSYTNVEEMFYELTKTIIDSDVPQEENKQNVDIKQNGDKKKSGCC